MAENQKSSVSFGMRYGYGLGEFGFNFLLTFITFYLSPFLTNVVGLPMVAAASIVTATSLVKLFGMPIAGALAEGFKFKGSTFRGWMLVGTFIFAIGGTLLFYPVKGNAGTLTAYYVVMFFVYWLGYCLMWTNHRGLMTKISANPVDRVAVTAASSQLGTIARVIFSMISAAVVARFVMEGGVPGPVVQFTIKPIGWTVNNLVFGIIAILCFIVVSAITKKCDSNVVTAGGPKQAAPKMTWADIKNTFTKPMFIFVICAIFRVAILSVMGGLLNYYVMYVVGDLSIMQVYMVATYAISFLGALLVTPLTKKIGKRNVFIYTTLASALCIFALLFVPKTSGMAFMVCMCLFQFFGVFSSTLIPVCMADIGEYNALVKGSKAQGLTFSIGGFALQIAAVFGTAVAGFGCVAIGFDPAKGLTPAEALRSLYIYGLGGLSILSALLFFLYPLTEEYMAKLRAEKAPKAE